MFYKLLPKFYKKYIFEVRIFKTFNPILKIKNKNKIYYEHSKFFFFNYGIKEGDWLVGMGIMG